MNRIDAQAKKGGPDTAILGAMLQELKRMNRPDRARALETLRHARF
jgi:hypothetical protein